MPKAKQFPPPPPSANGHAPQTNGRAPQDHRRLFRTFGVEFVSLSGDDALAEACPWCAKRKLYVNITSGLYHCKACGKSGNVATFLTWQHDQYLKATTPAHYSALRAKRGIAPQTLAAHGLAYDPPSKRWLVPFRDGKGGVVNMQQYYPDKPKPNKYMLPGLPTAIYGYDKLAGGEKDKSVFVCEGPWDAIALDYHLKQNRHKYVIVGTPGAFKEAWAEYFRGRKVRVLYDNDKGGREQSERVRKLLGDSGVAAELLVLKWPDGFPDGCDVNDLVCDPKWGKPNLVGWVKEHSYKATPAPRLVVHHGRRPVEEGRQVDWPWPDHLRCGTYVSFAGRKGTFKSTIMQEVAARYTTGREMPLCDRVGMPAGHVLYLYAEDDRDAVENGFERAGGDFDKWHAMPAVLKDGDPLNVLDHLEELRQLVREYGVRLVIIDGQNSVVGAPNISTDMLARHNVTNKLHQFAQTENVCLMGVRNEDPMGRALGPQSMGDLGRCVLRAVEEEPKADPPYCTLIFERISDTARTNYPPIPYSVEDLGGSARRILWGKERPTKAGAVKASATALRKGGKAVRP